METSKIAGVVLLVVGVLGLAYGGFTYTKDTHRADIGSLHLEVNEKQHVNIPVWAGIGAILVGGLLLMTNRKA
jgi:TRAP-type C4-dicarboxylate transport system permease small subunit